MKFLLDGSDLKLDLLRNVEPPDGSVFGLSLRNWSYYATGYSQAYRHPMPNRTTGMNLVVVLAPSHRRTRHGSILFGMVEPPASPGRFTTPQGT